MPYKFSKQKDTINISLQKKPPPLSTPLKSPWMDHGLILETYLHRNQKERDAMISTASSFDEVSWVIQIRRTLSEERDHNNGINTDYDEDDDAITIFNVPKALMESYPDSYTPQQVALGPYHHWKPALYDMERYKLAAAKRTQKQLLETVKFETLVHQLTELEQKIRASYHKFLDFSGETLAWMMAMDASFLLEFLKVYAIRDGKISSAVPSMSHLVDYAGRKSAHNAILRDVIMLENQIPLFALTIIVEFQHSSTEFAHDLLESMLKGVCNELFPFKSSDESRFLNAPHLLGLLYNKIVPKLNRSQSEASSTSDSSSIDSKEEINTNTDRVSFLKRIIYSRPAIFFQKLPLAILSHIPGFSFLTLIPFPQSKDESTSIDEILNNKAPSVEELSIPCVAELAKSGIRFTPSNSGISAINFDKESATLSLPIVSLDVNSEVVLRNLVAYEAAAASGPLIFTRYTELMNGIIDTEEDARLLRESGIILNRLKSDGDVADLWNGMSKSIRLTKVAGLDKVIEDVNRYYNGRWKVRIRKFMKKYVFESWQLLTFVAGIWILMLLSLQVACSVFRCGRTFRYI